MANFMYDPSYITKTLPKRISERLHLHSLWFKTQDQDKSFKGNIQNSKPCIKSIIIKKKKNKIYLLVIIF